MTRPTLLLLMRPDCELCEQLLAALRALGERVPLPAVRLQEVDTDPELKRRYGLKIPVLLLDGAPICSVRLDEAALVAAVRSMERKYVAAPADRG